MPQKMITCPIQKIHQGKLSGIYPKAYWDNALSGGRLNNSPNVNLFSI